MDHMKPLIESFMDLKAKYTVNDLISKETKYLFILESPHRDELIHGIPVAGASGRMMSKIMFQIEEPLGMMVCTPVARKHASTLETISIMNVSPIPLQSSAYLAFDKNKHQKLISILEKVRINLSQQYRNSEWTVIRNLISHDFISRLLTLESKNLIVIPCGQFAQFHYLRAKTSIDHKKWGEILGIPHPSRNQWYHDIKPLQQLIKSIANA